MNDLYEALEICLEEIEQGAGLETVLSRYPDLAEDLRPILEASVNAKSIAVPAPAEDVVRRNRARVLQHAAQLRESQARSSQRIWFASLRRVAVTLAVIAVLFISSTNLVRAASTTLPGDNLYPVKRTWEDVLLLFTFNVQQRNALEVEHENERLQELRELFAEGRTAEVEFAGLVTSQNGNRWVVAGVPVLISSGTELRDGPIQVGSAVRVKGQAQGDGTVLAERVRLLPAGAQLPTAAEIEVEEHEADQQLTEENSGGDNSGKGSGEEEPRAEATRSPDSERKDQSFEGTVTSIESNAVIVNGIEMDTSAAQIKGVPSVGATVKVEGYYDANGTFVVTKIEYKESGSGSDGGSGSVSDPSSGTKDDHSGSNSGSDGSGHDSTDDSGGGGSNSGSGGGGGDG